MYSDYILVSYAIFSTYNKTMDTPRDENIFIHMWDNWYRGTTKQVSAGSGSWIKELIKMFSTKRYPREQAA